MIMARDAPLNGVKQLTASPLLPTKKPLVLEISVPSAVKVFNKDRLRSFLGPIGLS